MNQRSHTSGSPEMQAKDKESTNALATEYSQGVNANALAADLKSSISGEVRFDEGSRALYATDASNYRQVPIGVVVPRSEADILNTIAACRKHGAPLLSRGGGTSLAGQCCNVAVVLDHSKYYNHILHTDVQRRLITVQGGIVLDDVRRHTRSFGLTFGPDPATHSHCTIGGMIGNNSCGIHSVMAQFRGPGARTSDNVQSMTVVTYDGTKMTVGPTTESELEALVRGGGRTGEIYAALKAFVDKYGQLIREKFPKIPRRVSGYNLTELLPENGFNVARALVGSEGTLVTVLDATLQLIEEPASRCLLVLGYKDLFTAAAHVPMIMEHEPIGLEGIDELLIEYMRKKHLHTDSIDLLPEGKAWLFVEFGAATDEEGTALAQQLIVDLGKHRETPAFRIYPQGSHQERLWQIRESGLGATAWVPGEKMSAPGWEDSAVDPKYIAVYLQELIELFHKYGYNPSLYGHFGQGCVHCRVQFDLFTKDGLEKYREFTVEAAKLVTRFGGSVSGEHGDGQARADLLEIMYGPELVNAFREFKAIWDPQWKMNPGKIVDAYGQLSNLRIDNHYNPKEPATNFKFTNDEGRFSRATLRCVGVGECRREGKGVMCPSYMVTHEEEHSTRGRARMLFEMMDGTVLKGGWKNKHVKDALDLCLACKGCKSDCPVNVDMATYKAEFLSHHYKGKLRPRSAYAFGFINKWAAMASVVPGIANALTRMRGVGSLMKRMAGISQKREIPQFAKKTFRAQFASEKELHGAQQGQRVILWADTFNNYFTPEVLRDMATVLAAAGFSVSVPEKHLCCGRPLYDFGLLKEARSRLEEIVKYLLPEIEAGIPVVGAEPSCVAVFRDELKQMLPDNRNAIRLSNNFFTLAEFLQKYAPDLNTGAPASNFLVHTHCHHHAVMTFKSEKSLLDKLGFNYHVLDSGCCGMAGNFGYEAGRKYDVSVAAANRALLPAIRNAEAGTSVMADGFSCREQIRQLSGTKALHLSQVLAPLMRNDKGKQ